MIYYQSLAMNTTVCCKTLCTNVPLWYVVCQEFKNALQDQSGGYFRAEIELTYSAYYK